MPLFDSPFAQLDLIRQPEQQNEPLQAFDAADEYLLAYLAEQQPTAQTRVLVLNDGFGALAASLAGNALVTSSGDSFLALQALEKNLVRNGRPFDAVPTLPASEPLTGPFDRVLIKVPKTLALLEEQLIRLQGQLAPGAQVIAGAMIKHLPRAAGDLLERYIGPVQASLAVKKARLLIATPPSASSSNITPVVSPYPTRYWLEEPKIELLNHANVFCREGLDIGTRAFLPHLPKNLGTARVADLGCGNGVLAIASALQNPEARYTLVDESYMAVQSAAENWRAALGEREATIRAGDGLAGQEAQSLDVVLCNPPFHQQQVVGDFLAWRMFQQAREALVVGGALHIVGNRHLGYHSKLARLFRGVEQVAATPKFVILKARK
ncbi:methyltransferase [Pseudomonas sp. R151218B TE3479]